jgi:hypothetical protein
VVAFQHRGMREREGRERERGAMKEEVGDEDD